MDHIWSTNFKNEIEKELKNLVQYYENFSKNDVINKTAKCISNEEAVGWFQGRMEFGIEH